ncbi:MAG TPA: phospholipase D-like domain-containing protein [Vicinamibacterales bacterium]|jgi:phosphatidylserine/phosphatidylglycerophosphate/cardiolipin synthase-like enzyme
MKLLIQPRDGVAPLIAAINKATKSVELVIFRFNRHDVERALHAAVARGVCVHALIAHTNHGGAGRLRKLEQRLLGAGATVDRTGDDFIRYHGKFLIVDRTTLLVLGFNYTVLDITRSRSFGIVTTDRKAVQDAVKLFEADCARRPYLASGPLVVSPENARRQLSAFVSAAKTQLLVYDPKISDIRILNLLKERARAGVDVRIIGKVSARGDRLVHQKYAGHRLHVRAILRDGRQAFVGSQSLRRLELDKRREVGVFVRSDAIVRQLVATFEADWADTKRGRARPGLRGKPPAAGAEATAP